MFRGLLLGGALTLTLTACAGGTDANALTVQECKDAVTAQLAYPDDADFPFFDPTPEKDSSGTWHVYGTVTAKNGFGGSHVLHWSCTVDSDDNVNATVNAS